MPDTGFFNPQELQQIVGIQEGMRVADFGSGSGELAAMLAAMVGQDGMVTAIDVLPSAIESIQARAKHKHLNNIEAVRADLEVLRSSKLADDSQNVVYLANILWQSDKKAEILFEATRVLKHGGTLVAIEWNQKQGIGPPKGARITEGTLKALVSSAGLVPEKNFVAGAYHYGLIAKK